MRLERNVLVPLADGTTLAADLRLPDAPGPFPALVSFYPYHKDDLMGFAFDYAHRYFAEHGYAHVLADFRGLGGSSGIATEAMSFAEAADGAELVEWVAAQPWCDGAVGMWGGSYGGITSFQTASLRPPHLRAIAPIFGSVDTYFDFFYPGGCFNCLGAVGAWGSFMLAMLLSPPMFQDPGGRWHDVWQERLERAEPYLLPWLDHPDHDEFWQAKAIPAERIEVPSFFIVGWRDIFPEGMVRAYERVTAPKKMLAGPWLHSLPDSPAVVPTEYLPEMLRWFDRWVRGEENGVDGEPPVTLYVQGDGAGWKLEREWPIARARERAVHLAPGGLLTEEAPAGESEAAYTADPTVGIQAGLWDPKGGGLGLPLDQRRDDERSLAFTGAPLDESLEITGSPGAVLYAALDKGEEMNLVVKLCDVSPDGASALITTGWLRGSHRLSHERPEPLPRGEMLEFRVPLWATSYRVAAGHRLRVSVSCSDFPRIWPTRKNPRIRLVTGGGRGSRVLLPVVPPASVAGALPAPADPAVNRASLIQEFTPRWAIEQDLAAGAVSVSVGERIVATTPGGDGKATFDHSARATVAAEAPHGARVEAETRVELELPAGGRAVVEAESRVTLDGLALTGRVTLDGQVVFERRWRR